MTDRNVTREQLERIVIACISECSGIPEGLLTADSDLTYNGIAGDDGFDIVQAIRSATGAKLEDYDFYPHFGPEAAFALHSPTSLTVDQLADIVEADLCRAQ
jgi:hypothetical protein